MRPHSTIRGTIKYTSVKPDRMNAERGREYFSLTNQSDGTSVLHAHCEIDDEPDVIRDVMSSFETATMRPIDASVRLSVGGKFEGSAWYKFDGKSSELEVINAAAGRLSKRLELSKQPPWFGHHAIINDGFLSRFFPLDSKPGKIRLEQVMMSSPDHRGATGPEMFPLSFSLVFVGHEKISTAIGTHKARKFQITDTEEGLPDEHPPYEMWCTADEDGLFLKGSVGGYMQTYYELVELIRD